MHLLNIDGLSFINIIAPNFPPMNMPMTKNKHNHQSSVSVIARPKNKLTEDKMPMIGAVDIAVLGEHPKR